MASRTDHGSATATDDELGVRRCRGQCHLLWFSSRRPGLTGGDDGGVLPATQLQAGLAYGMDAFQRSCLKGNVCWVPGWP